MTKTNPLANPALIKLKTAMAKTDMTIITGGPKQLAAEWGIRPDITDDEAIQQFVWPITSAILKEFGEPETPEVAAIRAVFAWSAYGGHQLDCLSALFRKLGLTEAADAAASLCDSLLKAMGPDHARRMRTA